MPTTRRSGKAPVEAIRILGLDPGSRHTGFGVIDRRGSKLTAIAKGRISLPGSTPLPERLGRLAVELREVVRRFEPRIAVLESLYHGVNPKSLIVLAQARGALIATLAADSVDVHEYTPAEVKTAVTGSGRADKGQVSRMVRLILGLGEERLSADASDALAVAICFAQRLRLDRLGARPAPGTRA